MHLIPKIYSLIIILNKYLQNSNKKLDNFFFKSKIHLYQKCYLNINLNKNSPQYEY